MSPGPEAASDGAGAAEADGSGRRVPVDLALRVGVGVAALAALAAAAAGTPWAVVPVALAVAGAFLVGRRSPAPAAEEEGPAPDEADLPSREAFTAAAQRLIDGGTGQPAVLVVQIDRFRDAETVLGDEHADRALREVAARLAQVAGDLPVGSLGGERFAVAMMARPFMPAHHLARSIREALARPLDVAGIGLRLGSSVGIALGEGGAESLLRRASAAAVAASADPDGLEVHRAESPEVVRRRVQVASALTDALDQPDQHQFRPEFQPIVDVDGRMVSAEALARWNDPTLGRVNPDEFVGLAEQTGQVNLLFSVILRRSLAGCAIWRARGLDATVSVNVSALTLRQPLLVSELTAALEVAGLRPEDVTLEVTETAVISDARVAIRTLGELRQVGFNVALDDFGIGQSSLARLRELPVTSVKLDKSFVDPLPGDERSLSVVQATVHVCATLGLYVVAEGVERPDQQEVLAGVGVDRFQGYLFSRSVDVDTLLATMLPTAAGEGV